MRFPVRIKLLTALLLLPQISNAAPDLSTPKSAAKSLFMAVEAQDQPAIIACFYTANAGEKELASVFADMIVSASKLNDACRQKYAINGTNLGTGIVGKEQISRVDSAQVKTEDQTATLTITGEPRPLRLRNTDGKWQLILSDYANLGTTDLPAQSKLLKSLTTVLNTTTAEVIAEKYATVEEAEQAIQQKLAAVMIAAADKPRTQPTTEPAK